MGSWRESPSSWKSFMYEAPLWEICWATNGSASDTCWRLGHEEMVARTSGVSACSL
jgi:hypothetical protein